MLHHNFLETLLRELRMEQKISLSEKCSSSICFGFVMSTEKRKTGMFFLLNADIKITKELHRRFTARTISGLTITMFRKLV